MPSASFTDRFGGRAGLMLIPLGAPERKPRADRVLRRLSQRGRDGDHSDDVARGCVSRCSATRISDSIGMWVLQTGFDLSKWDPTCGPRPRIAAWQHPPGASLARARDLSFYAAANYQGVPGLTAGGGVFTGNAGQGAQNFAAPNARVTLWEGHARWQTGPFDFSALYARGTISDTRGSQPRRSSAIRRRCRNRSGARTSRARGTRGRRATIRCRRSFATNG